MYKSIFDAHNNVATKIYVLYLFVRGFREKYYNSIKILRINLYFIFIYLLPSRTHISDKKN